MVRVWDLFIRVFHWSLVVLFATAYLSAEWRAVHLSSGYAIVALLAARLVWGFAGPRYARLGSFINKPAAVVEYLRQVQDKQERRYLGHNPAGGAMVVAMLVLLIAVSISGLMLRTDLFWGSEWMQALHGWLANAAIALLPLHVAGVVVTGLRHRENLVWSMLTGLKRAPIDGDVT